jgi:hypothetical protein
MPSPYIHLPQRQAALAGMVAALKPGGHLLVEDFDATGRPLCPHAKNPDDILLNTVSSAFLALLATRGADLGYGGRLPHLLRTAGLTDVRAEGHVSIGSGASAIGDLYRANIEQTRDQLTGADLLTDQQIEQFYRRLADPRPTLMLHLLVSATGKRP